MSGHHPYSTTFIVFSMKNAEMLIFALGFFLVLLMYLFLRKVFSKYRSSLDKKVQEFKESCFFNFPLKYIFENFLMIQIAFLIDLFKLYGNYELEKED